MSKNTEVLIIANQFPPMGGSGVQRTSKFVKYLPLFGYTPVVLTRDAVNLPIRDNSLSNDVRDTEVIRTKSHDYSNLSGAFKIPGKILSRKLLIPDAERIWADRSTEIAANIVRERGIKLIYSTSYPYSDHLLALTLKKRFCDIKWVCDFRDEWTNNPYTLDSPHNPIRSGIEKRMEREVINTADALISNTPVMVRNFIELNGLSDDNFHTIPNGYDEDDFPKQSARAKTNKFTLTYTGALYGRRKPDTFYDALSQLLSEGAVNRDEVSLTLIGNYIESRLKADIERFSLTGAVNIAPYMPHKDCINALLQSDCLLLIEGSGRGSEAFYTGKIFEYMMARTPVLAIIPKNGAAAGLVAETGIGTVADFNDVSEIKSGFMKYYTAWKQGEIPYTPNYAEIAKYERKELTKKLASVFDNLLGFAN